MIPKIIHYCWFGSNELPALETKCLNTWKEILPDFKIILWNEKNTNLSECEYIQQAYHNKKYAFVSDYVRIHALYVYGGIYLDTDVEILKPFGELLNEKGFLGFENKTTVGTAVMACEKGADFAKKMVDYYHSNPFMDKCGHMNLTTNVTILNNILEKKGLERINKEQVIDGIKVVQREVFYPKKFSDNDFRITENTISIHRMKGSWLSERQKKRGSNKIWINICRPILKMCRKIICTICGERLTVNIELWVRNKLR